MKAFYNLNKDEIKIKVILCEFEEKFSIFPYKMKEMGVFIISKYLLIKILFPQF